MYIYIHRLYVTKLIHKEKREYTWECEAKKNLYINLVWFIDLGNPNYPHLGKRVRDGTLEPWNQKKWRVSQLKNMAFLPIKLMGFLPLTIGWLWTDLSGAIYCTTMGVLMIQCGLPMIKLCFSYCSAYNEEIDACRSFGISKVLQSVACDFESVANTLQVVTLLSVVFKETII